MLDLNFKGYIYFIFIFSSIFICGQENKISPNFIFYLSDDQDLLDYGAYGNPKVYTPAVDNLAKEGMKFTNFYTSQAICAPSRSQIFTGMYPLKNGCMANHLPVKPNIKTIIDYLGKEGYEVVLVGKGHVKPNKVFQWSEYFKSLNHRYLPFGKLEDYLENVKKPFCVFIASDFPHGPYPKLSDYEKKDIYQLPYDKGDIKNFKIGYYQNIKDDNSQLENVLKIIESNHLVDNSIFIYASDHGISGKWTVAEQGLKVPFIVRWPGVVEPNSTSETMLNFVDILPTFLEITGAKIPNNLDGKSFKPILQGSKKPIHKYLYSLATMQNIQNCKVFPSRAVRDKRFKLVRNYNSMEVMASNFGPNPVVNQFIRIGSESFPNVPYEELYDLKVDPYQQNNLINKPEFMDIKNRLSLALKNWMIAQDDFLIHEKMPLIKPTLHPLDRNSKWNKVSMDLVNKLNENDYTEAHY